MIIGVFGRKGTGKTVLIETQLSKLNKKSDIIYQSIYEGFTMVERSWVNKLHEHGFNFIKINFSKSILLNLLNGINEYQMDHITLFLDDYNTYFHNNIDDELSVFIRTSRTYQNNFFFTTHRPYDTPRLLTALSDYLCVFFTTEQRDLKYFENIDPKIIENMSKLKEDDYNYILYNMKTGTIEIKNNKKILDFL